MRPARAATRVSSRHRAATRIVAAALLALAACGDTADPARLAAMEAEVRSAARALLDGPGFVGTAVRAGEDRTVTRADWADYRANGDYRLVSLGVPQPGEAVAAFGLVQVGAALYSARAGPLGDQSWARLDEEPTERIPLSLNLADIAAGTISPAADAAGGKLTRETGPGGEVRWSMAAPHRGDRLVQTWVIGGDGALRSYVVRTESGAVIQGTDTAIDYAFTPLSAPAPITVPPLGAPLDLAALGVPGDLPLAGETAAAPDRN